MALIPFKPIKTKGRLADYAVYCNTCGNEVELNIFEYDKTVYVDCPTCEKEKKK